MRRYGGTSIRTARASRAEMVVVKSSLVPRLLPAIQLPLDMLVEVMRVEKEEVEL